MLSFLKRLFSKKPRPQSGSAFARELSNDVAELSGNRQDWIEPSIKIAESELSLENVSEQEGRLARRIVTDAMQERLELPMIPELGLAVRRKTQDPLSSAADLTQIVQADVTVTAKLIQVANSPVYAGYEPVLSLNEAIARMGMTAVRDIVMGLTVRQMFVTQQPRLRRRMRDLWEHSTRVAANCAVLARHQSDFDPEQALLAGLVHDIGELAIIQYANGLDASEFSDEELVLAIEHLKARIGALLLRSWRLDEEFVFAALHADKLDRDPEKVVRLVDLIQVAQLYAQAGKPGAQLPDMLNIPAVQKLGLAVEGPEKSIVLLQQARRDIEQLRATLAV